MKDTYAYHLYSPRPDYGTTPVFYHRDDLPKEGFISLYSVDKPTAMAINQAGTCKGYKGIVFSERLWIDVDSYEAADAVEERLREAGYDYVAYDTGGRGAHFGILRLSADSSGILGPGLEGMFPCSHLLPLQDKQYVQEHFPEADSTIYTHLHPFRLPGTPHHRTGKRKTLVSEGGGRSLALPAFKQESVERPIGEFLSGSKDGKSILDITFITRNSEPAKAGERHAQLVRLCYALRDNGYGINIARWWVNEVNKRFQPKKTEEEIEKVVQSIFS